MSSKDGLHLILLKPAVISTVQAILPLSLGSTGTSTNSNLSWLDNLPSADDPKLRDGMRLGSGGLASARALTAEVLEWQGRHNEVISNQVRMLT
jgi:hypothetical protein